MQLKIDSKNSKSRIKNSIPRLNGQKRPHFFQSDCQSSCCQFRSPWMPMTISLRFPMKIPRAPSILFMSITLSWFWALCYITYLVRTNMCFCFFRISFSRVSVSLICIIATGLRSKPRSVGFIIKVNPVAINFVFCIENFHKITQLLTVRWRPGFTLDKIQSWKPNHLRCN